MNYWPFLKPDVDADKAALEVEEWKQKQKERFKTQLQGLESHHVNLLTKEWEKREGKSSAWKTQWKWPKNTKNAFLPVFELMSDSLMAIYVELHQCPLNQSILLTKGPIHEIFTKKYWDLAEMKNKLFFSRPFWFLFLFCFIPFQISHNLCDTKDWTKFWWLPWFPAKS